MPISHILEVAPGFLLPQIVREDLRSSALMDQTGRKPFGVRNLNHVGKFAYNYAVARCLAATWPGFPNLEQLQAILTADNEIVHLSRRFGLDKSLTFDKSATDDYDPLVEVFYAWMGAVSTEQELEAVQEFVNTLIGTNMNEIMSGAAFVAQKEHTGFEHGREQTVVHTKMDAPMETEVLAESQNVGEGHGKSRKRKARPSLGESTDTAVAVTPSKTVTTIPKRRRLNASTSFLYSMKAW
ncbi:hypothetical protein TWF696_004556 [Orbilia brochopaga]|uniref:RNase III domain-containing protein n=1 Tax=Orbilia brochopaga TaxID=3140254 RepID=A0AAV9V7Q2_9PEZI